MRLGQGFHDLDIHFLIRRERCFLLDGNVFVWLLIELTFEFDLSCSCTLVAIINWRSFDLIWVKVKLLRL